MFYVLSLMLLLLSTIGLAYYYTRSVQPMIRTEKQGSSAFEQCGKDRSLSGLFETLVFIAYIAYALTKRDRIPSFPWPYPITAIVASILIVVGGYLFYVSIRDAGKETMKPNKDHDMFKGIYEHVRHPQTTATLMIWFGTAIMLNQIFLFLYTLILVVVYVRATAFEERDLILKYGDRYIDYQKRTPAYIPRFKKEQP